jgi:hypothetical protein
VPGLRKSGTRYNQRPAKSPHLAFDFVGGSQKGFAFCGRQIFALAVPVIEAHAALSGLVVFVIRAEGRYSTLQHFSGVLLQRGRKRRRLQAIKRRGRPNGAGPVIVIHYDIKGNVTSVELAAGERSTPARALLLPGTSDSFLACPVIGFLLPWAVIKGVVWVVLGFTTPKG